METNCLPAIRCTQDFAGPSFTSAYHCRCAQRVVEPIVRLLPVKTKNLSFDYKALRFVTGAKYDTVARHHVWFGSFTPEEQTDLLTPEALAASDDDIYAQARQFAEECDNEDPVTRMQSVDTRLYLAEDILTKVDRASMAVSLEVRAPFLDPRVAEFAASLPSNYKLRGHKTKYILKKAVHELLPPFVTKRGKKGFGVPVAEWLKEKLRPLARDLLSPERVRRAGVFNPDLHRAFAGRTRTRRRESSQTALDVIDVRALAREFYRDAEAN